MTRVPIRVLEQNRFIQTEPSQTERYFNEDLSEDYFICPCCESKVVIKHREDERGIWPDVDLPCEKCGKHWGILFR